MENHCGYILEIPVMGIKHKLNLAFC